VVLALRSNAPTFAAMVRTRDFLLLLLAFSAAGTVLAAFVRLTLRPWWQRRWVRVGLWSILALDVLVPTVWFALMRTAQTDLADSLVTVQLALFFGQLALGGALVALALLHAARRLRRRADADPEPRPAANRPTRLARRRFLLQAAALSVPAVAAATGVGGVAEASGPVRVRRRTVQVPGLPPALAGLRILHFADVHLWDLVKLPDLQRALDRAPRGEYDLVCVTGDLADDMTQLPPALRMIARLGAPLGHYACLGNHEHARGLGAALRAYADGPVDLLRASGKVLTYRGQRFTLAGIDDLRAVPRTSHAGFYPDQIRRALGPTDPDAFCVLLSHRPSVLPWAAAAGVDLVLAGHTHGGQFAIAGKSILELNGAVRWAWGIYRADRTVMHVTCGLGQWFPFRLGCPPEMVLLELQPGDAQTA